MIELTINGEHQQLSSPLTLQQLKEQLQLAEKRIAIELNREIIPASLHSDTQLQNGDQVEIVHAIGGG